MVLLTEQPFTGIRPVTENCPEVLIQGYARLTFPVLDKALFSQREGISLTFPGCQAYGSLGQLTVCSIV